MTVIAYKNGTLAADSAETSDDNTLSTCRKIYKVPKGFVGTSGDSGACIQFVDWVRRGRPAEFPDIIGDGEFSCLLVTADEVMLYENNFVGEAVEEDTLFIATGCGAALACMAMACGKTAVQAVEMTCERHAFCGGPVVSVKRPRKRGKSSG